MEDSLRVLDSYTHHDLSSALTPYCKRSSKPDLGDGREFRKRKAEAHRLRTGCIPCLEARVKCDSSNPDCQYHAVSDYWRCNSDVAWQWHGTWRQRRGLHVFINFAKSPERAGIFESNFWQRTVPLACLNNEACFHIGTAIGALHEHIFRRATGRGPQNNSGLEFALTQCNRSIGLLTASNAREPDPDVALITCVLFVCFEALHGDPVQAVVYSLQGRTLLKHCERMQSFGRLRGLVDPIHIRPVMEGLEVQAKSLQGKGMAKSDTREEPPLPDASRLHSMEHANWTMHYVYIALLVYCQDVPLDSEPYDMAIMMGEKYLRFSPWLKRWEKAFADLLFREGSTLSLHDKERAKVLKVNHIAATLLANVDQGLGNAGWARYEKDFKAIIDLSASVLHHFCIGPHATMSSFQFPFLTFGLWVAEPLFMTTSRCCNPEYRRQAAGLLAGELGQRVARSHGTCFYQASVPTAPQCKDSKCEEFCRTAVRKTTLEENTVNVGDKSRWSTDELINLATNTRMDYGMAVYFGRFPPKFIDKPVFIAHGR